MEKFPWTQVKVHDKRRLENAVKRCRERKILIPTFAQHRDPSKVPAPITAKLKKLGFWDIDSTNLFRLTWKNDPKTKGFGDVNFLELPSALTGVEARIVGLVGKYFPTGAHKVGASFGCLVPRLVSGAFDPTAEKAVFPSTGNYCRGGAYDAKLLGCQSIAILPQEMSRERFEWLKEIGAEVIATPGCESNVKEIFDKCWELKERPDVTIFNQFDEFGNAMWHYEVTGSAVEEAFRGLAGKKDRLAAYCVATGSAGTIAAGDYLRKVFPRLRIAAAEALQCPTLLNNGFGGHRIEGIGDKHVPWIHNVRNTDVVVAVDDDACMHLLRLFNEPAGRAFLKKQGVPAAVIEKLDLMGISCYCNMLTCVKVAKHFELGKNDVLFTVFTDSLELYGSRLEELRKALGPYTETQAAVDWQRYLLGAGIDNMLEVGYRERKRIHNLKYYTWIEQQGRELDELNAQWYDENYWDDRLCLASKYDKLIEQFNAKVAAR